MSREYDLEEILAEYAGQDSSVPVPGAALSEPAAEDAPSPAADGAGEESIADADDSSGADDVSEEELPEAAEAPERQEREAGLAADACTSLSDPEILRKGITEGKG